MNINNDNILGYDQKEIISYVRVLTIKFAYKMHISEGYWDDIVQETLILIDRNKDKIRTPEYFKSWIFKVCQNKCIEFWRRQKRYQEVPFDIEEHPLDYNKKLEVDSCEKNQIQKDEIQKLLNLISHQYPTGVMYVKDHYLDGLEYTEISKKHNTSIGSIKASVSRTLAALREKINIKAAGVEH